MLCQEMLACLNIFLIDSSLVYFYFNGKLHLFMVIKIVEFIDFQNKEKCQSIKYLHLIKNKDGILDNQPYIKMHI